MGVLGGLQEVPGSLQEVLGAPQEAPRRSKKLRKGTKSYESVHHRLQDRSSGFLGPPRELRELLEPESSRNQPEIQPNPTKIKPESKPKSDRNQIEIESKSSPIKSKSNQNQIKIEIKPKSKSNQNPNQNLGNPKKSYKRSQEILGNPRILGPPESL